MRDRLVPVLLGVLLSPAREAAAILPPDFQDEIVVSGAQPVGLAFLPDGRLLFVERTSGRVRLAVGSTTVTLATVPDVNTNGYERGLLGVAPDPGWPARPYLYIHFTRTPGDVIYITRYTAAGDLSDAQSTTLSLSDRYDILTDLPDLTFFHNGGTVRFGPDDMLYVSLGEDGTPCQSQDPNALAGKILRLDVSGLPDGPGGPPNKSLLTPPDNPFVGQGVNAGLVFALGFRNPFRFTIDALTGRLYVADVGEDEWEEVDEVAAGDNCGWPFREGPAIRTPAGCAEPGGAGSQVYTAPIAWYSHAGQGPLAVVGGVMYRRAPGGLRNFPPSYDGSVFYGDFHGSYWRAVKRNLQGAWTPDQPDTSYWATGILSTTDMLRGPDGAVYYASHFERIRRISYTGPPVTGVPEPVGAGGNVLRAYPNPLRRGGRLVLRGTFPSGSVLVSIYDASGREVRPPFPVVPGPQGLVLSGSVLAGEGSIPPPGVYFVRVAGRAGSGTARLVVLP